MKGGNQPTPNYCGQARTRFNEAALHEGRKYAWLHPPVSEVGRWLQ